MSNKIDICLSPSLLPHYQLEGRTAVIVDILRATSCMVAGIANGVRRILPVATIEECRLLGNEGYICAGERNGITVEGFAFGNSPFSYLNPDLNGKQIAMTTTNGTQAILQANRAEQILIGAFLNLSVLAQYLQSQPNSVTVVCAGWKGKFSMEDTLFAGALATALPNFEPEDDSVLAATELYTQHKHQLLEFLKHSAHYKRLNHLETADDMPLCLTTDQYPVIPVLAERHISKLSL